MVLDVLKQLSKSSFDAGVRRAAIVMTWIETTVAPAAAAPLLQVHLLTISNLT